MNDQPYDPLQPEATGPRLNGEQTADLADHMARMAKAGLPLSPGFRAMAEELPHSRLARVLRRIAQRLDAGATLEEAMEAEQNSFPSHLRGLVIASARSGNLAAVMERFVALQRQRTELQRRIWMNLAYPMLLLSGLLALFTASALLIVPQFAKILADFGAELPMLTKFVLAMSLYGVWMVLGALGGILALAVIVRLASPHLAARLWHTVPVIGPMLRWSRMTQFARLMELMLALRLPAPEALRACAEGLQEPDLARGCRKAAVEIESGLGLAESLAQHRQFPPTLAPFLTWGQANACLPEAFRAAAEAFEGRAEGDLVLLEAILLPFTLVLIVFGAFFLIIGLFLPLISLVQRLT
ncbi:MAG: type II secretion system F family protein [Pirellulales bacterium]|nr:type II secretion system F family protein [Pirellulales bacterium]